MRYSAMTESQKVALNWWDDTLSINEMKELTKKYLPEFSYLYVSQVPHWVEEIYRKEQQNEQSTL